ncbi:MAG TPA: type II CAAX endopeptidase family protein [Gaiellaceae bacterium]|nr:type II CAAX endopeptidase family protein [Gaiellaceae bacterium]
MKRRFATTPANGTAETTRLAWWLALVAALIALGYGSRIDSGKPAPDILYQWSTAIGGLVQDAVVLGLVLWIAGFSVQLLALRRPSPIGRTLGYMAAAVVAIYIFEGIYVSLVHPGNEQGLTPPGWEPAHAAAYVANGIVICVWVPLVEELTFRGLGYSLLSRFGERPAIVLVGILFGLAHGLVLTLPVIVVFGCMLAWIRARTGSVLPGMVVHGTFNLIALVAAVTVS